MLILQNMNEADYFSEKNEQCWLAWAARWTLLCSSRHSTVVNCVIIYRVNGPLVAREPAVHAEQGSAAGRSSLANDVDSPERERERARCGRRHEALLLHRLFVITCALLPRCCSWVTATTGWHQKNDPAARVPV